MDHTDFNVDEWVGMVSKFHSQFDAKEHILMPAGIDVDGDTARRYAGIPACHFKQDAHGSRHHLSSGNYDMSFTRNADGLKMSKARQEVRWVEATGTTTSKPARTSWSNLAPDISRASIKGPDPFDFLLISDWVSHGKSSVS